MVADGGVNSDTRVEFIGVFVVCVDKLIPTAVEDGVPSSEVEEYGTPGVENDDSSVIRLVVVDVEETSGDETVDGVDDNGEVGVIGPFAVVDEPADVLGDPWVLLDAVPEVPRRVSDDVAKDVVDDMETFTELVFDSTLVVLCEVDCSIVVFRLLVDVEEDAENTSEDGLWSVICENVVLVSVALLDGKEVTA